MRTWTPKVCRITTFWYMSMGFGLLCYLLFGFMEMLRVPIRFLLYKEGFKATIHTVDFVSFWTFQKSALPRMQEPHTGVYRDPCCGETHKSCRGQHYNKNLPQILAGT